MGAKIQKLRRRLQRAGRKRETAISAVYELLWTRGRNELRKEIRKGKTKKWRELCQTVDNDVWGKPYKAVMKIAKDASLPTNLSKEFASEVLTSLFPRDEGAKDDNIDEHRNQNNEETVPVSATEILQTVYLHRTEDLTEILKTLVTKNPQVFLNIFNGIVRTVVIQKKLESNQGYTA